jgi:hypothetical protein
MQAVTVHDVERRAGGSVLAFDLIEMLRLDESGARSSVWRCCNVECTGELADALHAVSASREIIPGDEFVRLASGVAQVIDGDFLALQPGASQPWLLVRAVDSTLFVVVTENGSLLDRVRRRFRDVRDSPEDVVDLGGLWNG